MRRPSAWRDLVLPPPAALGLALVLAGWVGTLDLRRVESRAGMALSATGTASEAAVSLEDVERAPLDLAILTEAPLFAATREPWAPPPEEVVLVEEVAPPPEPEVAPPIEEVVAEEVAEPPPPPEVEFLGAYEADGVRKALVRSPGDGEETWLEASALLGEWTVVEIRQDGITLQAGADEVLVNLRR